MTTNQAHGSIVSKLAELDAGERAISAHRRDLHRQIDILYLSAPLDNGQVALLDRLEDQERDVSAQRHDLHKQIGELRVQVGLSRGRDS